MVITLKDYKEIRQRYLSGESIRSIAEHMHMSPANGEKILHGRCYSRSEKSTHPSVRRYDIGGFIIYSVLP